MSGAASKAKSSAPANQSHGGDTAVATAIAPLGKQAFLEVLHLVTGRPVHRALFEFWLKIFGLAFELGVVSGIVMAFEFGTN